MGPQKLYNIWVRKPRGKWRPLLSKTATNLEAATQKSERENEPPLAMSKEEISSWVLDVYMKADHQPQIKFQEDGTRSPRDERKKRPAFSFWEYLTGAREFCVYMRDKDGKFRLFSDWDDDGDPIFDDKKPHLWNREEVGHFIDDILACDDIVIVHKGDPLPEGFFAPLKPN